MRYRPWELSDIETLASLSESGETVERMQEVLDRSKLSIQNQLKKLGSTPQMTTVTVEDEQRAKISPKTRRSTIEKAAISFMDIRTIGDENNSQVWDSIMEFQDVLKDNNSEQGVAHIHINTDQWIGVAFAGDLHIGNMATDYKTMLEHRDLIAKTPNLYVALNGDYCDNYIPSSHAAGMFEALFAPAVQKNMAKDYVESIKHKILAVVAGCHDVWSLKASDFDLTEYLAKHGQAVYLGNGGTLQLKVGDTEYKIMMRHKYRYNSADNPTSTVKKMFEKMGGFDVGVVSHHHTATLEEATKEGLDGNLKRLFLRAGTYKIHDRFGKQLGFSDGTISVPVVLFNPARRDIRGFQNIHEGIEYLDYLNKTRS